MTVKLVPLDGVTPPIVPAAVPVDVNRKSSLLTFTTDAPKSTVNVRLSAVVGPAELGGAEGDEASSCSYGRTAATVSRGSRQ